jgi:hypothetical protein
MADKIVVVHKPESVNTDDMRKAYRREWMRKQREAKRNKEAPRDNA